MVDKRIEQRAPRGHTAGSSPASSRAELTADLFKALANPARVRIIEVLAVGSFSVREMQLRVGLEASHLSQQLGVLRRAGLVVGRRQGTAVIYSLSDPEVADLLGTARRVMVRSLDAARRELSGSRQDPRSR